MVYLLNMIVNTPADVIRTLKTITGDRFDSDLAKRLGVDKQSISQYKHKKSTDIQLRIISLLLSLKDDI